MERPLTVGQLAHATGVSAKTMRYYEQVGVLPALRRSGAGYRQYSRHDVHPRLFMDPSDLIADDYWGEKRQ
jgi:MerR family copper efflux transcriptional regulator